MLTHQCVQQCISCVYSVCWHPNVISSSSVVCTVYVDTSICSAVCQLCVQCMLTHQCDQQCVSSVYSVCWHTSVSVVCVPCARPRPAPHDASLSRDTLILAVADALTCLLAGFAIFSILGNLALNQGTAVSEVVQEGEQRSSHGQRGEWPWTFDSALVFKAKFVCLILWFSNKVLLNTANR